MIRLVLALTLSLAACGGKTTPKPAAGTPEVPAAPASSESLGGIALGDDAAKVEAALGPPASKGEVVEWEATGDRTSEWTWPGVKLQMAELDGGARFAVHSIWVEAPSTLKTSRGVGIGTPFAEVDRIYAPFRGQGAEEGEPEQWNVDDGITVGSVYGGTMFNFADGKVATIFVGAAAE